MLKYLDCPGFFDSPVRFHSGLNVVLGDQAASNSIGKTTLLMLIDFVHGGNDFLTINRDVVEAIGEHSYNYYFEFGADEYFFRRETANREEIIECDRGFEEIRRISLDEYKEWLSAVYETEKTGLSFRSISSLFSRIWRRKNDDVDHPLHVVPNKKSEDCVNDLLRLFERYRKISELNESLKKRGKKRRR